MLKGARNGDWDHLADYIEGDGLLTQELRAFISAGIVRGNIKRSRNRPPKAESQSKARASFMLRAITEGTTREVAIRNAIDEFSVSRRTIERDWERHGSGLKSAYRLALALRRCTSNLKEELGCYQLSATALNRPYFSPDVLVATH